MDLLQDLWSRPFLFGICIMGLTVLVQSVRTAMAWIID